MTDHPGTRVTCVDEQTGESESAVIKDNHIVIADGRAYVSSIVAHANGTHVITVRIATSAEEARSQPTKFTRNFGSKALTA